MNAKYADVVKTDEVLAFFDTLPSGMYELPSGNNPAQKESKRAANF
jgi:maleamate amidohydrolase